MTAYSAGTVFLEVVPVMGDIQNTIGRDARAAGKALGKETGDGFSEGFNKDAGKNLDKVLGSPEAKASAKKAGEQTGTEFSGAFQRAMAQAGRDGMRGLGKGVDGELDALNKRLEKLQKIKIGVDFPAEKVLAEIAAVRAAAEKVAKSSPVLEARYNGAAVSAGLRKTEAEARRILGQELELKVGLDTKSFERQFGQFESKMKAKIKAAQANIGDIHVGVDATGAEAEIGRIRAQLTTLDARIGVDIDGREAEAELARLTIELAALSNESVDIAVKANTRAAVEELLIVDAVREKVDGKNIDITVDMHGVARAVTEMEALDKEQKTVGQSGMDAANSFRAFSGIVLGVVALGPLIIPVLGAIGAGLAGIGPLAVGAAAGAGVAVLGLTGITAAVQALAGVENNAEKDSLAYAKSMRTASNAVRDAQDSLAQAREMAARSAEDSARRVEDANAGVVEAERRVADAVRAVAAARTAGQRSIEAALRQQSDAEARVAATQRDAQRAQEDLVAARIKAAQDIKDLQDRIAGGKLDERQALIDEFQAKAAFDATMADGSATNVEKDQARINYERAQLAIKNIREENAKLAAEKKDADAKGVDGSKSVQDAQQKVTDAVQAQKDAQQAVKDAAANVAQAQVDAAARVADAQRSVADAQRGVASAIAAVAVAEEARRRASEDGSRSISKAQQGVTDAQIAYQDALKKTGDVGSSSMQKLEQAMGKLGPAGREFARYIFSLRGYFYDLRRAVQEGFLPGLQSGMKSIMDKYGPGMMAFVGTMGKVLGNIAKSVGNGLTGPAWSSFFEMVGKFAPIFTQQLATIIGNVATGIASMLTALAPFGKRLGDAIVSVTQAFADWAAGLSKNKSFQKLLDYLKDSGPKVVDAVVALALAMANLAVALAPYADKLLGVITNILLFIAGLDPKMLGTIVIGILGLVGAMQAMFAIVSAVASIGAAIGGFLALMELTGLAAAALAGTIGLVVLVAAAVIAALVALGVGFYEAYQHVDWFKRYVDGAWALVKKIFWGAVSYITDTVFPALAAAATWLWERVLQPTFRWIGEAFQAIGRFIKAAWDNVIYPIIQLFGAVIGFLWTLYVKPALDNISAGWHNMGRAIKSYWQDNIQPVFEALGKFISEHVAPVFRKAVDGIVSIWEGLKEALKAPVFFVVETIINKGLIDNFNKLADAFGTKHIPRIDTGGLAPSSAPHKPTASGQSQKAAGFYAGGYTGPGAKYQPAGIVHADEFVLRKEATNKLRRRYGLAALNHMNQHGEIPGIGGYASGGLVAFGKRLRDMGFNVGEGPDPFGPVHRVHAANSWHYKGGAIDVNYDGHAESEGHAIGRILGMAKEYGLRTIWQYPGHYNHAHFDIAKGSDLGNFKGKGSGIGGVIGGAVSGIGDALSAPFNWLKDKVMGGVNKLKSKFGDNTFVKTLAAIPVKLLDMAKDKIGDMVSSVGDVGSKAVDAAKNAVGAGTGNAYNRRLGKAMAASWGWDGRQWADLESLWNRESGWQTGALNRDSGAYGIPQALPAFKMASAGDDWHDNPATQIKWGLDYIKERYGNPSAAWAHSNDVGWYAHGGLVGKDGPEGAATGSIPDNGTMLYDNGGYLSPGLTTVMNLTGKPEPVFTSDQFQHMQAGGSGGAGDVTVNLPMMPPQSTAEEIAGAVLWGIKTNKRGGKYAGRSN